MIHCNSKFIVLVSKVCRKKCKKCAKLWKFYNERCTCYSKKCKKLYKSVNCKDKSLCYRKSVQNDIKKTRSRLFFLLLSHILILSIFSLYCGSIRWPKKNVTETNRYSIKDYNSWRVRFVGLVIFHACISFTCFSRIRKR